MIQPLLKQWFKFCPNCQNKLSLSGNSANCSKCNFLHYLNPAPAITAIIEKDSQILIAKRGIAPQKDMWDLPGGFVDIGESVEKCVLREVKEETNLEVKIEKFLGTTPDIYGETGKHTINMMYWAKYQHGQAKPQDDVVQLEWRKINDLPKKFAFENCRIAINRYIKLAQQL